MIHYHQHLRSRRKLLLRLSKCYAKRFPICPVDYKFSDIARRKCYRLMTRWKTRFSSVLFPCYFSFHSPIIVPCNTMLPLHLQQLVLQNFISASISKKFVHVMITIWVSESLFHFIQQQFDLFIYSHCKNFIRFRIVFVFYDRFPQIFRNSRVHKLRKC